MEVAVHVHGALAGALPGGRRIGVSLPEGATVGDLVAHLAKRLGAPFARAAASGGALLPREIRLFVGGALAASREQPLATVAGQPHATHGSVAPVTVVLLTPLAGG
jgi:hypothetical protein